MLPRLTPCMKTSNKLPDSSKDYKNVNYPNFSRSQLVSIAELFP